MKLKLLSVFLFITAVVNAQIVNIPDAALKTRLLQAGSGSFSYVASGSNGSSIDIDANNDNEIQVSEALAVWKLNLYEANITSLAGLEAFTNLRVLWIRENYVTHIDATVFPNLQELSCGDTGGLSFLNSINVNGMTTLKNLHCSNNNFTSLDLTGLTNLENLTCMNNNLTSLDISDSPMLKTLDISKNNINNKCCKLSSIINLVGL
jgi:Leucine-rich repeat (LRR) protein